VDKPPYRITETGWGEFPLNIRVQFQPETGEKTITFVHNLKLHHWGPVLTGPLQNAERPEGSNREVETPLPESTGTPGVETIGNSRAGTELDDSVRIEVETEAGTEGTPRPAGSEGVGDVEMQDSETAEAKEETDDAGERNRSESVVPKSEIMMARPIDPPASDPTNPSGQPAINPLPVHSWQYDQFVFTDPTHQFYQLLIAHPETPLPEQSIRKGQSEGEGAVLGVDRGSAGVPLEFTKELERGEWEMMENGRKGLIEEMDRWRSV
jgi:YEATS domain-containing protein 4